ncbi:hypothetical protein LCGC14_2747700 [marine sediment metagenome]|uniref:Uncharacterized protein n=1 Tax=marine sediment metagenome TaxID=412755 RepID=A0A0F9BUB9_9ZZZZ
MGPSFLRRASYGALAALISPIGGQGGRRKGGQCDRTHQGLPPRSPADGLESYQPLEGS